MYEIKRENVRLILGWSSTAGVRERTLRSLWKGLMTYGQNSTGGVRARMPESLWRGHVSASRTSRVVTSTWTSLRLRRKLQGVPEFRLVPIDRRGLHRTGGSSL
jgi:hypothetical protein